MSERKVDARTAALAIMKADMASGKATKRSLGVMYAHVMAGSSCAGVDFWRPINQEIIAYGHAGKDQFAFLEGVKKVAWSLFEAVGKEPGIIDEVAEQVRSEAEPVP